MNDQTQPLPARSGMVTILLAGICACAPDGAEGMEAQFAANLEQAESVEALSLDEFDVESHVTIDTIEQPHSSAARSTGGSGDSLNADFNGDGYADLAIGVPFETSSGGNGGGLSVLYGSASGLTAVGEQFWNEGSPGLVPAPGQYPTFGVALAAGDFNHDGYTDLAIGGPYDRVGSEARAGVVRVLYGSASGLTADGNQIWHQDSPGIEGVAGESDWFGYALSSGDYDGDGYHDLAVGVPFEDPSGSDNGGAVNVIYGSSGGLTEAGNQIWHQDTSGVNGIVESGDLFGGALASGDLDNDGCDDLAIGVSNEGIDSLDDAGVVNVLYGSKAGLSASGDQYWHQDSDGIKGVAEVNDGFGYDVTIADFDNDGFDDLAVGVPFEGLGSTGDAGAVNVIYGSQSGLTSAGDQFWHQNSSGVDGVAEQDDGFGRSLAAGDFDDDGYADLATGVSGEDLGDIESAGVVNVLYGAQSGLTASGDQIWHQNIDGILGAAEEFDSFGIELSAGDFDADGAADLVVGVPDKDLDSGEDAGAVHVLYGREDGLTSVGDQIWHQNIPGVTGEANSSDRFGYSVR